MVPKPKRRDPMAPMLAALAALLAILLMAAALTGQWVFLLLGLIAVGAALVPIISRR